MSKKVKTNIRKRVWIVGGSSGIGLELVKEWLYLGHYVIVSARKASENKNLEKLKLEYMSNLNIIDLDVTQTQNVEQTVPLVWKMYDGLDLWFYNAGTYDSMTIDTIDVSRFEQMNDVNYLGAVRVMSALIPLFKTQQSGHWVWNASLSSYFGLPYGGGYSAPKAALVNLAQSLQPELLQHNIKLQIINHGFVKTRLTQKNDFEMPELMEPKVAAHEIIKAINTSYRFEIHFPFKLSTFLAFLKIIPYKWALSITKKMLR